MNYIYLIKKYNKSNIVKYYYNLNVLFSNIFSNVIYSCDGIKNIFNNSCILVKYLFRYYDAAYG